MNEEADAICNAARYQRSPDRVVSEFLHTFFLTDCCSFINLHHLVKFASVQILASSPLGCRNISESCSDQHHGGIGIRKCSDYAGAASNR